MCEVKEKYGDTFKESGGRFLVWCEKRCEDIGRIGTLRMLCRIDHREVQEVIARDGLCGVQTELVQI